MIRTASSFALKELLYAATVKNFRISSISHGISSPFYGAAFSVNFSPGAVILRVRVPEEMALIFPTVDSGWPHETCFPFYFPPLTSSPSHPFPSLWSHALSPPSVASKNANRQGHDARAASPSRSAEIATDVVVKFQCRESLNCSSAAPLTFLTQPPHLCPRRLYVAGILPEKYLCNIARNPAADSSFVDPTLAYGSSFACIRLRVEKRNRK